MHIYVSLSAPVNLFLHQGSDLVHPRLENSEELIPDKSASSYNKEVHSLVHRERPAKESLCFVRLEVGDVEAKVARAGCLKVHAALDSVLEVLHNTLIDYIIERQAFLSFPKISFVFKSFLDKGAEVLVQKARPTHLPTRFDSFALQTKRLSISHRICDRVNCASASIQEYEGITEL